MGISIGHLLVLLVIMLLFFGPSRLEGLGSALGKSIRGFKDGLEGKNESNPNESSSNSKSA